MPVNKLQRTLQPYQAILLSLPTDIHYFTGFTFLVPEEREAFLFLTPKKAYVIKASFSPFPEDSGFIVLNNCQPFSLATHLAAICGEEKIQEILVDKSNLFVEEYEAMQGMLKDCQFFSFDKSLVWELRMVKTASEISMMKKAAVIVKTAIEKTLLSLKTGLMEKEVAEFLHVQLKTLGADAPAFPTIVAFGQHSAYPHYQPGTTKLKENTVVLIDAGALYKNYRSDMTRTVWFGKKTSPEFIQVKKVVDGAYQKALARLRQRPATARDVDEVARNFITEAGFEKEFIHTTGHGIGLDLHEPPSLNWKNEIEIVPGMMITIEPGIYLEGKFGYRYENTVLVTKQGGEEITL